MKKLAFLLSILFMPFCFTQCDTDNKTDEVELLINNILSFNADQLDNDEPIVSVLDLAYQQASKAIPISASNMESVLGEAQQFKSMLLVVGNHTLVKITDLENCKKSTSWGCCMPIGVAITQKSGEMKKRKDYINNLIGTPDSQIRTVFLFD